jgi:hypothetical protein
MDFLLPLSLIYASPLISTLLLSSLFTTSLISEAYSIGPSLGDKSAFFIEISPVPKVTGLLYLIEGTSSIYGDAGEEDISSI